MIQDFGWSIPRVKNDPRVKNGGLNVGFEVQRLVVTLYECIGRRRLHVIRASIDG